MSNEQLILNKTTLTPFKVVFDQNHDNGIERLLDKIALKLSLIKEKTLATVAMRRVIEPFNRIRSDLRRFLVRQPLNEQAFEQTLQQLIVVKDIIENIDLCLSQEPYVDCTSIDDQESIHFCLEELNKLIQNTKTLLEDHSVKSDSNEIREKKAQKKDRLMMVVKDALVRRLEEKAEINKDKTIQRVLQDLIFDIDKVVKSGRKDIFDRVQQSINQNKDILEDIESFDELILSFSDLVTQGRTNEKTKLLLKVEQLLNKTLGAKRIEVYGIRKSSVGTYYLDINTDDHKRLPGGIKEAWLPRPELFNEQDRIPPRSFGTSRFDNDTFRDIKIYTKLYSELNNSLVVG